MADLSSDIPGVRVPVAVSESVFDVVDPARAEARLVTDPASRSAWVPVYDAVQATCSPGSRNPSPLPIVLKAGHVSSLARSSATVTGPANRPFPVLGTREREETTSPGESNGSPLVIDFTRVSSGRSAVLVNVQVTLSPWASVTTPPDADLGEHASEVW